MKKKQIIITSITCVLALALMVGAYIVNPLLPIITGYGAKSMCSGVFIAHRSPDSIRSIDLNFMPISLSSVKVNYDDQSAESRFLWHKSKAIYREGFGVTLISETSEEELRSQIFPTPRMKHAEQPLPISNFEHVSKAGMDSISHSLIMERNYGGTPFSFMAVHQGQVIAEAYKPGVNKDTRLLSWSMGKSFTNTLAGMLAMTDSLDIYAPCNIPEWQNDERKNITLNDLLQMQSGLEWNENYGSESDVNLMLHTSGDMAHYVANKKAIAPAGTHWYYSSGSTNLAMHVLRQHINNDSLFYDLAINKLFAAIGATTAILETDPAGTMIGSSYLYARTADYARFGLMYLNDGVVNEQRILPEGWVKYTTTQASDSKGDYGSFFWLNQGDKYHGLPADIYSCNGHDGQYIFMIPSYDLVVVILGYSPKKRNPIDVEKLLADIISQVK